MKDVILSEPMFAGDLVGVYEGLCQVKQLAFHFLKIYWQFKNDASCLPVAFEVLCSQSEKSRERLQSTLDSLSNAKIMRKSLDLIRHFSQIHRNEQVDSFFVENSYKIFLKVIIKFLAFETISWEDEGQEYVHELDDLVNEQKSDTVRVRVAKLLESMVINTDGFLSFVFDFCLSFIEKSISDNPEEKELLTELSNNFKLDMTLPDYLNAAFVILSIIAD